MTSTRSASATGLPQPFGDELGDSRSLAALITAAAQPAAKSSDADILALGAEMNRREAALLPLRAVCKAETGDPKADEAYEQAERDHMKFMERIATMRATTLAGIAVKARAVAYIYADDFLQEAWTSAQRRTCA